MLDDDLTGLATRHLIVIVIDDLDLDLACRAPHRLRRDLLAVAQACARDPAALRRAVADHERGIEAHAHALGQVGRHVGHARGGHQEGRLVVLVEVLDVEDQAIHRRRRDEHRRPLLTDHLERAHRVEALRGQEAVTGQEGGSRGEVAAGSVERRHHQHAALLADRLHEPRAIFHGQLDQVANLRHRVVGHHGHHLGDTNDLGHRRAVGEHDPLGLTRRARCIKQGPQIVGRVDPLGRPRTGRGHKAREGDDAIGWFPAAHD